MSTKTPKTTVVPSNTNDDALTKLAALLGVVVAQNSQSVPNSVPTPSNWSLKDSQLFTDTTLNVESVFQGVLSDQATSPPVDHSWSKMLSQYKISHSTSDGKLFAQLDIPPGHPLQDELFIGKFVNDPSKFAKTYLSHSLSKWFPTPQLRFNEIASALFPIKLTLNSDLIKPDGQSNTVFAQLVKVALLRAAGHADLAEFNVHEICTVIRCCALDVLLKDGTNYYFDITYTGVNTIEPMVAYFTTLNTVVEVLQSHSQYYPLGPDGLMNMFLRMKLSDLPSLSAGDHLPHVNLMGLADFPRPVAMSVIARLSAVKPSHHNTDFSSLVNVLSRMHHAFKQIFNDPDRDNVYDMLCFMFFGDTSWSHFSIHQCHAFLMKIHDWCDNCSIPVKANKDWVTNFLNIQSDLGFNLHNTTLKLKKMMKNNSEIVCLPEWSRSVPDFDIDQMGAPVNETLIDIFKAYVKDRTSADSLTWALPQKPPLPSSSQNHKAKTPGSTAPAVTSTARSPAIHAVSDNSDLEQYCNYSLSDPNERRPWFNSGTLWWRELDKNIKPAALKCVGALVKVGPRTLRLMSKNERDLFSSTVNSKDKTLNFSWASKLADKNSVNTVLCSLWPLSGGPAVALTRVHSAFINALPEQFREITVLYSNQISTDAAQTTLSMMIHSPVSGNSALGPTSISRYKLNDIVTDVLVDTGSNVSILCTSYAPTILGPNWQKRVSEVEAVRVKGFSSSKEVVVNNAVTINVTSGRSSRDTLFFLYDGPLNFKVILGSNWTQSGVYIEEDCATSNSTSVSESTTSTSFTPSVMSISVEDISAQSAHVELSGGHPFSESSHSSSRNYLNHTIGPIILGDLASELEAIDGDYDTIEVPGINAGMTIPLCDYKMEGIGSNQDEIIQEALISDDQFKTTYDQIISLAGSTTGNLSEGAANAQYYPNIVENMVSGAILNPLWCANTEKSLPYLRDLIDKGFLKLHCPDDYSSLTSGIQLLYVSHFVVLNPVNGKSRLVADGKIMKNIVVPPEGVPVQKFEDMIRSHHDVLNSPDPFFNLIDLSDAFHHCRYVSPSEYMQSDSYTKHLPYRLVATVIDGVTYTYTVMTFGFPDAPGHFVNVMEKIREIEKADYVSIYVDDCLILGRDHLESAKHVKSWMDILVKYNFTVNPKKLQLFQKGIKYLGRIIDRNGIHADDVKLSQLLSSSYPNTPARLRSYLGKLAYLSQHVVVDGDRLHRLRILSAQKSLSRDDKLAIQSVCNEINKIYLDRPVSLAYPDFTQKFYLFTDACVSGMGGVLAQWKDGSFAIVATFQKKFTGSTAHWSVYRKEFFAVLFCLIRWHSYATGPRSVIVRCDNKSVVNAIANSAFGDDDTVNRWLTRILEFTFLLAIVEHIAGEDNILADSLSRTAASNPLSGSIVMPFSLADAFSYSIRASTHPTTSPIDHVVESSTHTVPLSQNASVLPIVALAGSDSDDESIFDDEIVVSSDRRTQPSTREERLAIVVDIHRHGHEGVKGTLMRLNSGGYGWPGIRDDVSKVVSHCLNCLKANPSKRVRDIPGLILSDAPLSHVQVDLIGPLVKGSDGHIYILAHKCVASQYLNLVPLTDKSALSVAAALVDIWSEIGCPEVIQSDHGSEFDNALLADVVKKIGAEYRFSAQYNPRCNGAVEGAVNQVKLCLTKLIMSDSDKSRWPYFVKYVQFILNTRHSVGLKFTPFELMYGRKPMGLVGNFDVQMPNGFNPSAWVKKRKHDIDLLVKEVNNYRKARWEEVVAQMKRSHMTVEDRLPTGTKVMLRDPSPHIPSLHPTWVGPYVIKEHSGTHNYILSSSPLSPDFTPPFDSIDYTVDREVTRDMLKVAGQGVYIGTMLQIVGVLKHKSVKESRSTRDQLLVIIKDYTHSTEWVDVSFIPDPVVKVILSRGSAGTSLADSKYPIYFTPEENTLLYGSDHGLGGL